MQKKNIPVFIDIVFCLILLPAMMTLLPIERWWTHDSLFVMLLVIWLYTVYVLNRCLIMPKLFAHRKQIWICIAIFIMVIAVTYLLTTYQMDLPSHRMRRGPMPHNIGFRQRQQAVWFLFVVVTTFSMVVGLLTELYRQMMNKQIVEFEKKKAELALYKAQINPHFLFNSLNTLYAMAIAKSDMMEDAFMQFINLMKYMYSNNDKEKIPITTEIEYIRQYIELHRYRMPDSYRIHFSYKNDENESLYIAPMILITFVENIFKHGYTPNKETDVFIAIRVEDGTLWFYSSNPLLNHKGKKQSKGIGIENCNKRMELLYPNMHDLSIKEHDGQFTVSLRIDLKT